MRCPACGTSNADSHRFCASCGGSLSVSDAETMAGSSPSRPSGDTARFVPGQVLGERYRMVGLLGKGGMGEVYRADDLKLGQPVALKFLPRDVESDPDRLERFLAEVRLSLQVTHPNVCRVFDIGVLDGRHFLSMEYVDGEDLASLLRRIGRLPEDKAVEIARQLCAGLAAAHSEGILHRDLKPANIMIDGRGRAKITDFGLAGAAVGIAGREARAGTPHYMAPEQFDGRSLTIQTDLYALGLVLYELFTGKRAFDGRDVVELARMRSSTPTNPSALVPGLSPVVERAILRCLDPDPARRPASAGSLAAALPGGDPVAMAIAAGETPSPEMVAQSGGGGELRPAVAIAALVIVLTGLGVIWFAESRASFWQHIAMPKPPEELRVAARATLTAAGYIRPSGGTAFGFDEDTDYFNSIEKKDQSSTRWDSLSTVQPAPMRFWYRESPRPMVPFNRFEAVELGNPPLQEPGMALVRLDPSGRLQSLQVVPSDLPEKPGPWPEPDWTPLFQSAGLTLTEWTPAEPQWASRHGNDVRRAWIRDALRIEAAAMRGQPVFFRVVPPWRQAAEVFYEPQPIAQRVGTLVIIALQVGIIMGAALLARRNLREGRGDRRGALRFASASVVLGVAYEIARLSGNPAFWYDVFTRNLGRHLYFGLVIWIFYVAVEPYVRRLWPGTLVAWSRVLDGRFRDAMVGRDVLLGAVGGLGFTLLFAIPQLASSAGLPAPRPGGNLEVLGSYRALLQNALFAVQDSFLIPVAVLVAVLLFRVILRRPWLAYVAIFVVVGGVAALNPSRPQGLSIMCVLTLSLLVLTRLGLLAFLVGIVFSSWGHFALTVDTTSWFFPQSLVTMAGFAAIAAYGFWVSLGNQKVFKDTILDR